VVGQFYFCVYNISRSELLWQSVIVFSTSTEVNFFMGRTCFIPNCRTGYKSRKGEIILEKYSLFSVPKDDNLINMWKTAIPRSDRPLDNKSYVCERHFLPHEILDYCETFVGVVKRC
jgi:hypothetical protein